MHKPTESRRDFLKKITTLGVMGTTAYLRSSGSMAAPTTGALATRLQGQVVSREDAHYETWRQAMIWQKAKAKRYPDLIVQARSEADIIEAVNYAREHKLKIAIRSSGHNAAGTSLRDGGMLLDISYLRHFTIDAENKLAHVQPALWCEQLVYEAGKYGLSFPAAHCPSVALGGYVLGGGVGWNHAAWGGPATHSIRAMEVITADGHKVRASATENPDLYWAGRGAGPGFYGVVTNLELELYDAPQSIISSMYIHPLNNLATVTEALEKLFKLKDERVEVLLLFMHNPQAPQGTSVEETKICFVGVNAFAESEQQAKQMLKPFAESELSALSVFKVEFQPTNFSKLYHPENVDSGYGRYGVDTEWTNDLSASLHAVAEHFKKTPSVRTHIVAALAMNTKLHDDACFSRIGDHFIGTYLLWDDEQDDDINYAWLDETNRILAPFSEGHYVNETAGDRFPQRYQDCYSPQNWRRLQQVRHKYDPQKLFHSYLGND